MKPITLEQLVKYTRTPYPVIIARATSKRGGWHLVSQHEWESNGVVYQEVRIEDSKGHFYRVAYDVDNTETSAFNEFGWPTS